MWVYTVLNTITQIISSNPQNTLAGISFISQTGKVRQAEDLSDLSQVTWLHEKWS